jgi:hypothetical protein
LRPRPASRPGAPQLELLPIKQPPVNNLLQITIPQRGLKTGSTLGFRSNIVTGTCQFHAATCKAVRCGLTSNKTFAAGSKIILRSRVGYFFPWAAGFVISLTAAAKSSLIFL